MSETYYKAVLPDGAAFHDPDFRWLPDDGAIPEGGHVVTMGDGVMDPGDAATYLSVSVEPADCTGFSWPCRLLRVEPVEDVITPNARYLPNKRAARSWRVVEELDPHQALGPHGVEVAALLDEIKTFSPAAREAAWEAAWYAAPKAAWYAAWDAAWNAALDAARKAAWYAARKAVWYAALDATWDVVAATVVRDLIGPAHYDTLTAPWRIIMGDPSAEVVER